MQDGGRRLLPLRRWEEPRRRSESRSCRSNPEDSSMGESRGAWCESCRAMEGISRERRAMESREPRSGEPPHGVDPLDGRRGSRSSERWRRKPSSGARPSHATLRGRRKGRCPFFREGDGATFAEAEALDEGDEARDGARAVVSGRSREASDRRKGALRTVSKGTGGRGHLPLHCAVGTDGSCGIPPPRRRGGPATSKRP